MILKLKKEDPDIKYKITVEASYGGYGFIDTIPELLTDVELEYGNAEVKKVSKWLKTAKENDEYISDDGKMHIFRYRIIDAEKSDSLEKAEDFDL